MWPKLAFDPGNPIPRQPNANATQAHPPGRGLNYLPLLTVRNIIFQIVVLRKRPPKICPTPYFSPQGSLPGIASFESIAAESGCPSSLAWKWTRSACNPRAAPPPNRRRRPRSRPPLCTTAVTPLWKSRRDWRTAVTTRNDSGSEKLSREGPSMNDACIF